MDKQTSSRITILGFVMTSVIVMYHCGATGVVPFNILDEKINKFLDAFFDNMAILAMSHFFFVTGYLLFYNLTESLFKTKIKRRFFTLIIPYILWQIITVVYYIILGRFNGWTIRKLVNTVFLMQLWPPDGALWYLYAVFLLACLSPIFLFLYKEKKIGWWMICIMIVIAYGSGYWNVEWIMKLRGYGYLSNILSYFPSYIIGTFYGYYSSKEKEKLDFKYCLAILLVMFVFEGVYGGILNNITIRIMPLVLFYTFPVNKIIENCNIYKLSFLIYAIHQPIMPDALGHIRNLLYYYIPIASIVNLAGRLIYLFFVIVISSAIYIILKRVFVKGLVWMTGGGEFECIISDM